MFNELGGKKFFNMLLKTTAAKMMFSPLTDEQIMDEFRASTKYTTTELTDADVENLQKNAAGLIATLMIYLILLMLEGLMGDDDDDEGFANIKFLLNQGGRLQDDLLFYTNPNTFSEMSGRFIPVMKLFTDLNDWKDNVYQTTFRTDPKYKPVYQSGDFEGSYKAWIKTGYLIPGTSAYLKIYRQGTKVFD